MQAQVPQIGAAQTRARRTDMINTLLVALGAGTFALAGAGQAPAAKPAGNQAEKKICLSYDPIVGSRIRQTECKTKAQWAQEGVIVVRPEKAK